MQQEFQGPTNFLVIVLDDVGTDKLNFYGDTLTSYGSCPANQSQGPTWPETPTLDALRANGILFRNFYANPSCTPTRACLQTGRYAFRTGAGVVGAELDDAEVLIPELLKGGIPNDPPFTNPDLPYACGAFGKWHLTGATDYSHAVDNGFDRFYGTMGNVGDTNAIHDHYAWIKTRHNAGSSPLSPLLVRTWDGTVTANDATAWINAQTKAFFAYVAFNAPHAPLQVPPHAFVSSATLTALQGLPPSDPPVDPEDPDNGEEEHTVDITHEYAPLYYRAMLEAVDYKIGEMLAGIDSEKLANTMIFVISDNGTLRNVIDSPPHVATHGKQTVYQLGVRVPMIVSGPLVPTPPQGGYDCEALVGAVDLWATIAEISGADEDLVDPNGVRDSISFLDLILDPDDAGSRDFAHSQRFSPDGVLPQGSCPTYHQRGVTDGTYKLIVKEASCTPTEEFYYLVDDPGEVCDLIPSMGTWSQAEIDAYDALKAQDEFLENE